MKKSKTLIEYLEARIDRSGGPDACWLWTGTLDQEGYAKGAFAGKMIRPHRVYANISEGLCGLHSCDNPPCCNPRHIFSGTNGDNNRDRKAKGRNADKRGSKHHMAKLDERMVLLIRARSMENRSKLAREFGVSQPAISMIINRRKWTHV